MVLDRTGDSALLLSQGLFGAPAGQTARDREAQVAREREESRSGNGDRPR
jgi:hypothetical protein